MNKKLLYCTPHVTLYLPFEFKTYDLGERLLLAPVK